MYGITTTVNSARKGKGTIFFFCKNQKPICSTKSSVPVHAVLRICTVSRKMMRRNISPFLTDFLAWTLFNTDSSAAPQVSFFRRLLGLNPTSVGDPDPQQWSSRDTSVADPGCLSRIRLFPSRIPDPWTKRFRIPDPHQRI
jgi:hypothetical protein